MIASSGTSASTQRNAEVSTNPYRCPRLATNNNTSEKFANFRAHPAERDALRSIKIVIEAMPCPPGANLPVI